MSNYINFRQFNVDSKLMDSESIQRKWFKQGRAVIGYSSPRNVSISGTIFKNTIGVSVDLDRKIVTVALKGGQETAVKIDVGNECYIDLQDRNISVSFK